VFAFEQPVGVVDVNAARVHARLAGRPLTNAEVQERADDATPVTQPWRWNQAVLDLGATVCTKRSPKCGDCPLQDDCRWRAGGRSQTDPAEHSARIPKRQSRFEGSDRQGRGRLVSALRAGPVPARAEELAAVMGWPDDPARSLRVAMSVVDDGLAKWEQATKTLCL
jgi:A/G-specific adenine glycosylase